MRKKVFGYQLSRDKNERKALFRGLVSALIEKSGIITTLAKAKAIQPEVEKLVTKAKRGTVVDRRMALKFLTKRDLVNRLFEVIGPVFKEKSGGYTKIVKMGTRRGDGAEMVRIFFSEDIPLEIKKEESKTEDKDDKTG